MLAVINPLYINCYGNEIAIANIPTPLTLTGLRALNSLCINHGDQRVFKIWNHHNCLSQLFLLHLNTYVMGLRPYVLHILILSVREHVFSTQNFFHKHLSWKIRFLFGIICLICLHCEVSEMGLRFFENLLMSYNYVISIHDRLALFLKCLFLIIK